jgi:hypothetical protein
VPENLPDGRNLEPREEIVKVRRMLLLIFGVGGVGIAIAITWAARNVPSESLRDPYVLGSGQGGVVGGVSKAPRCAKFGERCQHSPGKLGTCVHREGCTEGQCLFCQSQH